MNAVVEPHEEGARLSTFDVPEADRGILARRGQRFAVGSECHGMDKIGMPLESGMELAVVQVPKPHRLILARRGQHFSVGTEAQRRDGPGVPRKPGLQPGCQNIAEPDRPAVARPGQRSAIGAERQRAHGIGQCGQNRGRLSGLRAPEQHLAVLARGGQFAVRGKRHGVYGAVAGIEVPQAHGAAGADRGQCSLIGTEGDRRVRGGIPRPNGSLCGVGQVP